MAALRSRSTSYGHLTIERVSDGYIICLNGKLYKGTYSNYDDAVRDFDSLPN